jgi:TRAP-type C4-dicarboxylate transport system permease small subunit
MAPLFKDLLSQNEFWVFIFALGWALFNWPLITIATGFEIRGIPMILVYIASIWILIILVLYIFDRRYSS